MTPDLTRRNFLQVVLSTMPVVAFSGPLSSIWPSEKRSKPVAKPYLMNIEYGYLTDPSWEYDEAKLPGIRENRYDGLGLEERLQFFLNWVGEEEDIEAITGRPVAEWSEADAEVLEDKFADRLDGPEDPEYFTMEDSLRYGPHRAGADLLEALGEEEAYQLGLVLVEGDRPGSSFCGVHFDGDVDDLNHALAKEGLNMVVE
jgi:hypothetical protein